MKKKSQAKIVIFALAISLLLLVMFGRHTLIIWVMLGCVPFMLWGIKIILEKEEEVKG